MIKISRLIISLFFITASCWAVATSISGTYGFRHYSDSDLDETSGSHDKVSYFRNDASLNLDSEVSSKLSGKLGVGLADYEYWGEQEDAVPDTTNRGDGGRVGSSLWIHEAFVNYKPIDGLNARLGRQEWKFGNGHIIGNYAGEAFYSQNGIDVSYELPELFKIDLLYSILEDDRNNLSRDNPNYVGPTRLKDDRFQAVWLNIGLVPFVQNINFVYANNYTSAEGIVDQTKIDDSLTVVGAQAAGNHPIKSVKLNYSAEYYRNLGKNNQQGSATTIHYVGHLIWISAAGSLPNLFGLTAELEFIHLTGDKNDRFDHQNSFIPAHGGATLYFDKAQLFTEYTPPARGDVDPADATKRTTGAKIIAGTISATPLDDLTALYQYLMIFADQKGSAGGNKARLENQMVGKITYNGIDNLNLSFSIGYAKRNTDNYSRSTDHTKTQFNLKYIF